ncbi:hypothetical protein FD755_001846 [Muntiacus reevesi]|uniref:Uncharacterized protein n=1 Tax=Muntiacus reevesi TaxID=9886 RepID=A0A5J5N854_MUNRE|nr:hypothetical protein FD755_001846 [Muntiacus reevesi]
MPLGSSSSSMTLLFPSPLPSVPDSVSNSSLPSMSYITSQEMTSGCNECLRQLEVSEPDFVAEFYQAVAATAGKNNRH